ncbi:MAG: T9SS type A sorting domain-containing protein [Candidatus Zixiibacteriota bacterium]|nr:MAG: T9SS type A sorting domain-containing protein [candidate division Zixibacteria bacterium]
MDKIFAIIICLLLLFGIGAFADDTAFISGRVGVENSSQSILEAKLYLYNSHKEIIDSAYSSQNGGFQFSLIAGEYYLSAESGNFIREYYPSVYRISEAGKIVVFSGQNVAVYFSLDRGGWLGGIFDYLGDDVEKGLVTALKVDEPYAGWRRSVLITGQHPINYVLNGLIPGAYKVAGMASAKKTVFYPGVENIENADIIYVERNAGVPDMSFLLEPVGFGHVSGRAYDLNTGEGLIGIPIYAYQWCEFWTDPNMQSVITGEEGLFDFDLPAGVYNFYLNCDGCIPDGGRIAYYYDNQYNPILADKVEVSSGTIITGLDFAVDLNVSHGLTISGNIIDSESDQALSDVVVTAIDYFTGDAISSTYSISNGDYFLENLPSGDYLLQYSGSNVIPFFYRSTENWQNAEVIVLRVSHSGIQNEAITQDFGNLGLAISGNVLTPDGPACGARVYAYPVGGEYPIAYGNTGASGEYSITAGLVNGYYNIVCDLIKYNFEVYPFEIYLDLLENPIAENIDFLLEPTAASINDNFNTPGKIEVLANYPNPFNDITRIPVFSGSGAGIDVNLAVYNILGQRAGTKNINLHPGMNYISWSGRDFGREVPSGVYFYRIEGVQKTHKMVFLK